MSNRRAYNFVVLQNRPDRAFANPDDLHFTIERYWQEINEQIRLAPTLNAFYALF